MTKLIYKFEKQYLRRAIILRLLELGYMVTDGARYSKQEDYKNNKNFDYSDRKDITEWAYVIVSPNIGEARIVTFDVNDIPEGRTLSLDDLFGTTFPLPKKTVSVQLNAEYSADVTKDGVKVGCQTFPLDKIDELVAARAKVLK